MKASAFYQLPLRKSHQRQLRQVARSYSTGTMANRMAAAATLPIFRLAERWDGERWLSPLSPEVVAD